MKTQNHSATLRTMVLGLLGATALLTSWGSPEQRLAVSLVTALTPGVLAALLMLPALDPRGHWDVLDVAALSVCLAITIIVVLTGIVVALAGQVPATWLLLAVVATLLSLASRADNIRPPHVRVSWEAALHALILLMVAAPVRLIDLGFSEYQGDEASILHRAAAIVQGVDSALLSHRKGPGEILFTTFFGQVVGRVAESDTRLPFALVGIISVLGVYTAGRAMFGPRAGLVAGLLWAVNGYAVGFSRIVQYHSIMVLLTTVALMCAWRAGTVSESRDVLRRTALGLLAVGLAFGFNVFLLGLPALLLLGARASGGLRSPGTFLWQRRPRRTDLFIALPVLTVAVFIVLAWANLIENVVARVGQGQPFNNIQKFASVSVQYLGLPYFVLIGVLALGALVCAVAIRQRTARRRWIIALSMLGALAVLIGYRGEPTALAIGVWLVLTMLVALTPTVEHGMRHLAVAGLLILGLYAFLLRQPGTHWYEAFLPMVLLGGWLTSRTMDWLGPRLRSLVTLSGCLLLLAAGLYPVYAFLPIWPAGTSMPAQALYRPTWSDSRFGGNFGFPHQDGFKAVALLQDLGYVPGPYDSNTTAEVTRWYLPSAERCDRPRGSYVTAFSDRRTDSRLPGSDIWVITVRGAPRTIVRDQTTPGRPLAQLAAEAPTEWFDTQLARLDRPLTIPQVRCARPMQPAWSLN